MSYVACVGRVFAFACAVGFLAGPVVADPQGYYRQPAIHDDTIVFVAEGDLWRVSTKGGGATRLTSHPGEETTPMISPDGRTVAFVGQYEGPSEVYTMPLGGGLPTRRTYHGEGATVVGWRADGKIIYASGAGSGLPNTRLALLDISRNDVAAVETPVPLAQAADGCYDDSGKTLFFTRQAYQGSHTKRYQGGTAQNIWRYADGDSEATPLTQAYLGTSKNPMWWDGRIYFASDRDGTMNIWSMKPDGSDLHQHTDHSAWDVTSPSLSNGRIVYQLGADLHLYDIRANKDQIVPITLESDLDQTREHSVQHPMEYISAAHLSADGSKIAITARGQVFVVPRKQGRLAEATHRQGVRIRDGRFMPDGKQLLVLSDESGEVEFWRVPANGVGDPTQLTSDAKVLRWEGIPSPDGKLIAHHDRNQRLFIYDIAANTNRQIDESPIDDFADLRWSPDSRWLAYVAPIDNLFHQIRLYQVSTGSKTELTSRRYDSYSPAWSPDGKWLYLLSDRNLHTTVESPWGSYEPEPFLDKKAQIFMIALHASETRTPFTPHDELQPEEREPKADTPATKPSSEAAASRPSAAEVPATQPSTQLSMQSDTQPATRASTEPARPEVKIDLDGIQRRLVKPAISPGNYSALNVNGHALFWLSTPAEAKQGELQGLEISSEKVEVKTIASEVASYEMSQDGKTILVQKGNDSRLGPVTTGLFVIDAKPDRADLDRDRLDLTHLRLSVVPREEWRAMFVDAWRMERDYFYDRNMHGVDWNAVRRQYEPLVDRVTTRGELSDLLGQMISELSALHMFVAGGDVRPLPEQIMPASLGAALARDAAQGGYCIRHVYQSDPDEPDVASPLARFGVNVREGDVIEMVNGVPTLSVPDVEVLLRQSAGQQVLLHVKPKAGGAGRDVIVRPISIPALESLRYHEWEYTNRIKVEHASQGQIGYVHLRAMGGENFTEWAKGYFPVWNRAGLIIDVRHNRGGSIDSWIIARLLRKAWAYWSSRNSDFSISNMQYAFRGHVVVLCDEWTASDGEAFTQAIESLNLGKVIGTRTWGGEIWLSFDNGLVDRGIASAAETGVFGPKGSWLIEGHGVDPDVLVDNLPHATYEGRDAQLQAAIDYLQKKIELEPVKPVPPPKFPDKSFKKKSEQKKVTGEESH